MMIAGLLAAAGAAGADVTHRVVLKAGDAAPYVGPDITIAAVPAGLVEPTINQNGDVASFVVLGGASITDPTVNGYAVVGATRSGTIRLIARNGTQAQGLPAGVLLASFGFVNMNSAGRTAFSTLLAGTGVTTANDSAVYVEQPGGPPSLVIREGVQAPGLPAGVIVSTLDANGLTWNDANQVAASVTLSGPGVTTANASAIYRFDADNPGATPPLLRQGDAADFIGPGVLLGTMLQPLLATNGDLVFSALLTGAGVTTSNDRVIIARLNDGTMRLLIREGDPLPPSAGIAGGLWGSSLTGAITPSGLLAFWCSIGGPVSQGAVWSGPRDGSAPFRTAGVAGTTAVGLGAGQVIGAVVAGRYAVNDDGRAAFYPTITGTGVTTANDSGMFTEAVDGPGMPRLLAREGSPIVGVTPAANHPNFAEQSNSVAINARNQTVFLVRGTTLGNGTDHGLWCANANGVVSLVSFKNMPFEVAPGDVRTISFTGNRPSAGPQPAWRTWFNNRGEVVYPVAFLGASGNNSALVVSTIDPEQTCRADFNHMGGVTLQDLFDYLGAWFANLPAADFNGMGGVTLQDLFDYLGAWFVGCP